MDGIPPPPPPPPPPPIVSLPSTEQTRFSPNHHRNTTKRYTRDSLENALSTLQAILNDPKASNAQVRACELVIQWAAGKPGDFFEGDEEAFTALSLLPMGEKAQAAMQLFGQRRISRTDLDTVLAAVRADQTQRIADLERDIRHLENENKDLTARLQGTEIDLVPG